MKVSYQVKPTDSLREVRRTILCEAPFAGLWIGTCHGWVKTLEPSRANMLPSLSPDQIRWRNISRYQVPIFQSPKTTSDRVGIVEPGRSISVRGLRQSPLYDSNSNPNSTPSTPSTPGTKAQDTISAIQMSRLPREERELCWLRCVDPEDGWVLLGDGEHELFFAPEYGGSCAFGVPRLSWVAVAASQIQQTFQGASTDGNGVTSIALVTRRSSQNVMALSKSFQAISATGAMKRLGSSFAIRQALTDERSRSRSHSKSEPLCPPTASVDARGSELGPTPAFSATELRPSPGLGSEPIDHSFILGAPNRNGNSPPQDQPPPSTNSLAHSASSLPYAHQTPPPLALLPLPLVVLHAYEEFDERSNKKYFVTTVVVGPSDEYTFNQEGIIKADRSANGAARDPTFTFTMGRTLLDEEGIRSAVEKLKTNSSPAFERTTELHITAPPFIPHSYDAASHNCHHFCEAFLSALLPKSADGSSSRIPPHLTEMPMLSNGSVPPSLSRRMSMAFSRR
jgi:hypothetical protein